MSRRRDDNVVPMPTVPLLTVDEVATALRVSRMTVYRMIHDDRLPAVRVGRTFRVSRAAVEAALAPAMPEQQREAE